MRKHSNRLWAALGALAIIAGCASEAPPLAGATAIKQMPVDGTSLAYIDDGRGTPVVFVHGSMSDHRIWQGQRAALAKTHRFIAYDQRYFGTAPWPDKGEKFGLQTQIADLAAFIRGLGAGPVHLVGWSMGSATVLGVALRHPELVRAVLIYEPASNIAVAAPEPVQTWAQERSAMFAPLGPLLKAGDHAAAVKVLVDGVEGVPGTFDTLPGWWRALVLDNARTLGAGPPPTAPLTCEQMAQIARPVTIVLGEQSRPFFQIVAQHVARCVPARRWSACSRRGTCGRAQRRSASIRWCRRSLLRILEAPAARAYARRRREDAS